MCFSPFVPALGKEVTSPSLEKVRITWQKDDASPFVAIRLKHENCFGGLIDRIATRFSTWFVFKTMSRRYASFLKQNGIEVHTHELSWRPEGSRFGACHCLELSLLFGSWERWKGSGMLGKVDVSEWRKLLRSSADNGWSLSGKYENAHFHGQNYFLTLIHCNPDGFIYLWSDKSGFISPVSKKFCYFCSRKTSAVLIDTRESRAYNWYAVVWEV